MDLPSLFSPRPSRAIVFRGQEDRASTTGYALACGGTCEEEGETKEAPVVIENDWKVFLCRANARGTCTSGRR